MDWRIVFLVVTIVVVGFWPLAWLAAMLTFVSLWGGLLLNDVTNKKGKE